MILTFHVSPLPLPRKCSQTMFMNEQDEFLEGLSFGNNIIKLLLLKV